VCLLGGRGLADGCVCVVGVGGWSTMCNGFSAVKQSDVVCDCGWDRLADAECCLPSPPLRQAAAWLMCIVKFLVWLLENIVAFINRNAYIIVAVKG